MKTFTPDQRRIALTWYINGIMLQTIADHFRITVEQLKEELRSL